jgi:spore coat polysaccharide biosynthesis protein SpsF
MPAGKNLRTVAIIQARIGSTRFPGKVLKNLAGDTVLARVVNRTRRAKLLDDVVVATSLSPADDAIVQECERLSVACFRGDEADVLDRYYRAALKFAADAVVRITSDCPLSDPVLIDQHVRQLLDRWNHVDLVTNMVQQSFPLGLAVEALPIDVLERMHRISQAAELKEHVTTLAYVETKEDLDVVRLIFQHFGRDDFSWTDVLPLMKQHPDWLEINRHILQKTI